MLLMFFASVDFPVYAPVCGFIWCVARVIYGIGYAVKGPKGRNLGALLSHVGDLPLLVMCSISSGRFLMTQF